MPEQTAPDRALPADAALRARAVRVIPGGLWGHMNAARLPASFPQYFGRSEGCRLWDADGNEYIDFMCAYGPVVLGYRDAEVEAAVAARLAKGDIFNGPAPELVELAEALVDTVAHADWAMFQKNGTDATTACVTLARAGTGRRKVLVAKGAYHGAAPWCTPSLVGVTAEDRAHIAEFAYNDIASLQTAAEAAEGELAGVIVSAFRHDARRDQESPAPEFARAVRALCDRTGAALILDDVRAGFRIDIRGSWEPLGVRPDLSAWSKAIANGHPLAAVTGTDRFREAAQSTFMTGSFWCGAAAMAAALVTLRRLRDTDAIQHMKTMGERLREGLAAQARAHGVALRQTGPAQMPMLLFDDDPDLAKGDSFVKEALARGVYLHPWHNMFLSAAHRPEDIDLALEATDAALRETARRFS
ncbi:aminotransferase class III-fold pyridoxal phosphate-dependent enzyme [Pikeienuella piscinae]|uniref:Aminotransferase class III-fold pyridoxal phosphate-dependent enzyme n=1 Tax=Pikeienuella piscinae TaxID=2748098 RepID=A0A7M3T750_9RHOB|nr:aminotransferase class III-fold pyridoxal phosphate-dependent enzyme [Pikeienuella piscinae]QIE57831.1 aminotransferase class III-fold pyridoxal phosphate-dependent enzyme [Pikeienuella piscinae]